MSELRDDGSRAWSAARWYGAALAALVVGAAAADGSHAQPARQPDYHPSLGDLMTMAVQPRHIKLWQGGRARNWPYAAYEASELRNAFGRIARTIPTYRDTQLASMVASNMKDPLASLDAAIKARDGQRFDAAYASVTHACNACHQGLGHPEVVIRVPQSAMYPDQVFSPAAGSARRP